MGDCLHSNFHVSADVIRIGEHEENYVSEYTMDVIVQCSDCALPFEFVGLMAGHDPRGPTCSFDQREARIPIRPSLIGPLVRGVEP